MLETDAPMHPGERILGISKRKLKVGGIDLQREYLEQSDDW